jgi:hypothetical protein
LVARRKEARLQESALIMRAFAFQLLCRTESWTFPSFAEIAGHFRIVDRVDDEMKN